MQKGLYRGIALQGVSACVSYSSRHAEGGLQPNCLADYSHSFGLF